MRSALVICAVLGSASVANAFDLGAAMGGFVDQANKQDKIKLERQRAQLEQQRLEIEQERLRQQYEIERRRLAEDQARAQQAEQQRLAAIEAKRREEQAKMEAYRQGKTGSGFIVSTAGHIVTNAHVVGDYPYAIAKDSKGKIYQLDIVSIDKKADLALLRANRKSDGLAIMAPDAVSKGLKVYALGFPQPSIQGTESKITDGIISSMTGLQNDYDSFQISVPIQAGNSGGPLVTDAGAVVGVVVATVNARAFLSLTGDIPQNINYAIKTDVLERFLLRN